MVEGEKEQNEANVEETQDMTEETAYNAITKDALYASLTPEKKEAYDEIIKACSAIALYNFLPDAQDDKYALEKMDAFLNYVIKGNVKIDNIEKFKGEFTPLSDYVDKFGYDNAKEEGVEPLKERFSYLYEQEMPDEAEEEVKEEPKAEVEEKLPALPHLYRVGDMEGVGGIEIDLSDIKDIEARNDDEGFTYIIFRPETIGKIYEKRDEIYDKYNEKADMPDFEKEFGAQLTDAMTESVKKEKRSKALEKLFEKGKDGMSAKELLLAKKALKDLENDDHVESVANAVYKCGIVNAILKTKGDPKFRYICAHGGKVTVTREDIINGIHEIYESKKADKYENLYGTLEHNVEVYGKQAQNIWDTKPFLWGNETAGKEAFQLAKTFESVLPLAEKLKNDTWHKLLSEASSALENALNAKLIKDESMGKLKAVIDDLGKDENPVAYVIKFKGDVMKIKEGEIHAVKKDEDVAYVDIIETAQEEGKDAEKELADFGKAIYCLKNMKAKDIPDEEEPEKQDEPAEKEKSD